MSESIVPLKISSVDKLTEYWIAEGERIATERIIEALDFALIYGKPVVIERYQLIALIKGEK